MAWLAGDDSKFGIFTKNKFTALPALPVNGSLVGSPGSQLPPLS